VRPGVCYRLFSRRSWDRMPRDTAPEIRRAPLQVRTQRVCVCGWQAVGSQLLALVTADTGLESLPAVVIASKCAMLLKLSVLCLYVSLAWLASCLPVVTRLPGAPPASRVPLILLALSSICRVWCWM
jgi:hypothetical protein